MNIYREEFKIIGHLSSLFPAYVRQCCRSFYDGTDNDVLNSYAKVAYHNLMDYQEKYAFVQKHMSYFRAYDAEQMRELIEDNRHNKTGTIGCLAISTGTGLPKRACLHCPKMSVYMECVKDGYRRKTNEDKP